MSQYFTKDTDEAMKKFVEVTTLKEKHEIFNKDIKPAFEKLIENLIFVYSFYNIDDVETLKKECLSNLYEMIPRFDSTKGKKGFSYFNVIAKNWFIQKTKEHAKKNKFENELLVTLDHESTMCDPNFVVNCHEELVQDKEKWIAFYEAMGSWRNRLTKKTEKQVLEAIIFIMKNAELITIYNKKAVHLYIKDLTNLNTKQVVVNLKKIKELYKEWRHEYDSTGEYENEQHC